MPALLERLGIEADDWDLLIVGDGSGSTFERAIGWGSVSIDRATLTRRAWYGSANRGTVNFAETLAYVQPLEWLASRERERRTKQKRPRRSRTVHVLTDSRYCEQRGSGGHLLLECNAGLWAAVNAYARLGIVTRWHQRDGGDVSLNCYVDELSKQARRREMKYNLRLATDTARGKSADEHNPAED